MPLTIDPGTNPPPVIGPDPDPNAGTGTVTGAPQITVGGTSATGGVITDPATLQTLQDNVNALMAEIKKTTANQSKLDPPPGEEGHVNTMLLAEFPAIAFAMMELARTLMTMGFSMAQFGIKFTNLTYEMGVDMGKLQEALTKAQMTETQGEIIKDCIGIGSGLAMMAATPTMTSRINSRYDKQNQALENDKLPINNQLKDIDTQLNPGAAGNTVISKNSLTTMNQKLTTTNAEIKNIDDTLANNPNMSAAQKTKLGEERANLVKQQDQIKADIKKETDFQARDKKIENLETDIKNYEKQIADPNTKPQDKATAETNLKNSTAEKDKLVAEKNKDLGDKKTDLQKELQGINDKQKALETNKQHELNILPQHIQLGAQMITQIGNVTGAAMKLASQAATIEPAKAMKVLESVQTIIGQMLQSAESNQGSYESALGAVLQQLNSWVGGRESIKWSR